MFVYLLGVYVFYLCAYMFCLFCRLLVLCEVLDEHVEAVLRVHLLLLQGGALADELVLTDEIGTPDPN